MLDGIHVFDVVAPSLLPEQLVAEAQRAVEIIKVNQDAGGAYLASPAFPVYRYSWFRGADCRAPA